MICVNPVDFPKGKSRSGLKLCKALKLFYYQSDFHNVDPKS